MQQTLSQLMGLEVIVSLGRARGAGGGRLVADQARPAAARDDGRHGRRDRRRRPHAARAAGRAADGGRPARPQPEHDAQPHRGGVRGARRAPRRSCGASSPTPPTSCARRSPASAATPRSSTRAKDDPEDLELAMRRIEEESKRMGVMVEELLVLARLGEGREPEKLPVDLARVVDDAVNDARAAAPARDIALERVEAADVLGDDHQLRQVVANLLGNAAPPHARRGADPGDSEDAATAAPRSPSPTTVPGLEAGRRRQGVRALLPRRQVARPRDRRRRPRPRHRRRHRGGPRRRRAARHGARRRRHLHGDAAAARRTGVASPASSCLRPPAGSGGVHGVTHG